MEQLFLRGTYRGRGHRTDQKAEGQYTAQYRITDGLNGAKVHEVERIFMQPDGAVAYEERSSVTFEPGDRGSIRVSIRGHQGTVAGAGYTFKDQCRYEIDVTADNHLEFTFHRDGRRHQGLGSATNKGNHTYWKESLEQI